MNSMGRTPEFDRYARRRCAIAAFAAAAVFWQAAFCASAIAAGADATAPETSELPAESAVAERDELARLDVAAAQGNSDRARLVQQLDDDRFSVREQASQALRALGADGFPAVAAAAGSDSLEASTRAVNILVEWSGSEDRQFALQAIQRLAELKNHPTESRLATELLASVREYLAAQVIEQSGGHVVHDVWASRLGRPSRPIKVIIDSDWVGGEAELARLADLTHATTVSFHSAPVCNEAIPYILQLPTLERLEFFGTPVSDESLQSLREGLPNLVGIDIRSGALLGIVGSRAVGAAPQGGALVHEVQEGGAADKAGLRRGDVVVKLNDEKVVDFEDLTRRLAKYNPGQAATLTVVSPTQDGGAPAEVEVHFDRWGEREPQGVSLLTEPAEDVLRYLRPIQQRGQRDIAQDDPLTPPPLEIDDDDVDQEVDVPASAKPKGDFGYGSGSGTGPGEYGRRGDKYRERPIEDQKPGDVKDGAPDERKPKP